MSAQTENQLATEKALARKGRIVSLVIAGTMILWLLVQFIIGSMLGLTRNQVIVIDIVALVALGWSFFASWQIKRARKTMRGKT